MKSVYYLSWFCVVAGMLLIPLAFSGKRAEVILVPAALFLGLGLIALSIQHRR